MSGNKRRASKAAIEARYPYAVWIRVPPLWGLGIRLERLQSAAAPIGAHAVTDHYSARVDRVRVGFRKSAHAAEFRHGALEVCSVLVEPEEPPSQRITKADGLARS
jgi:hypothetical protein